MNYSEIKLLGFLVNQPKFNHFKFLAEIPLTFHVSVLN